MLNQNSSIVRRARQTQTKKSRNSKTQTDPGQILFREREATLTIPRSVNCVMPDRFKTVLRYRTEVPINLSVVPQQGIRFQPSAAYDVDPLVGGTSMKGFLELSQFYSLYRVLSSSCKVESVNPGITTPYLMTLLPLNVDPGSSPTPLIISDYREQPYAKTKLSALRGGPPISLKQTISTQKMYGSAAVLTDNNFSAGVTSVPINNWYWAIGFDALSVIPSSEGAVICYVYIEIDLEFSDRKFLL